ncbi:hypothetical protein N474_14480 [Pseudoalteromonas luteoviolacea CPMOR-2]|uniref:Uncharacterized protein n=1 Tax=Pseudoalteromonas luteoviolacea DSM 6061 TaxID=1365250 RepID=A0A166VIB6_9GAMM|nr:hypothetical protein N475_20520 [Pseudoalteromonas luteoviolacea DSM 6061]KZN55750.1 hypothetical protein N474_14480 [Pseudoalteromonas luteoviolacea CPMOR-2]MBE0385376.1 hypothetical protein [Pseudoalteromonas luteoviolacea DSM 6061]
MNAFYRVIGIFYKFWQKSRQNGLNKTYISTSCFSLAIYLLRLKLSLFTKTKQTQN